MSQAHDDHRPNPDLLLQAVQREEEKKLRGKLKVFLGMAPGVGKTFAMLSAAQELLARGVDVVAGVVETHHRAETEALLEGLPVIPRQVVSYRNINLEEMDLDAILRRRPRIVLVDEMAHTNAPGSRHAKRYQDVYELLEAGIDVYTTLNVQHLESRADTVQEITGVKIAETVPDSVIDRADEVVLVDLAPDELRERLAEGKVYVPEQAGRAIENFFQPANLMALRELSLRLVAERVDHELRDYQTVAQAAQTWKTRDRLMVAVYASPFSEPLIRWTRRMASSLNAPWYAAYVELDRTIEHISIACELFGGVYVGLQLPNSAQDQDVWDVADGSAAIPGSWGGHAVNVISYDPCGVNLITWGARKRASWEFLGMYCDEAYALLSNLWAPRGRLAACGLDVDELERHLADVTA